jgi:exodeoxyribonuclease-5
VLTLTKSQKTADKLTDHWLKHESMHKPFLLGGGAGTGKTFFVAYKLEKWNLRPEDVLVMAYTGQAVFVLRMRSVNAFTIHSQLYELIEIIATDEDGNPKYRDGIPYTDLTFRLRESLPFKPKLIIVEEASFVNKKLAQEINSFGCPTLYVGDHIQLPPVTGELYFTEEKLDFSLEDVMRQALDSQLMQFITATRRREKINYDDYRRDVTVLRASDRLQTFLTFREVFKNADMIICATNKQRQAYVDLYREIFHKADSPFPVAGEKMICRKNKWNNLLNGFPLVNGSVGYSKYDVDEYDMKKGIYLMDFQPIYIKNDYYDNLQCDMDVLTQPFGNKNIPPWKNYNWFEHGSAISVHLSQGAQYPRPLYVPSRTSYGEYKYKIDYTAVSRAEKHLFIVIED